MKRFLKIATVVLIVLLIAGLLFFFFALSGLVESALNRTLNPPPYEASAEARELHRTLTVADLHADSLLFGRDLLKRATRGHVDLPRLVDGNVTLQVFSAVTKSPRGLNIEQNDDDTDDIILIALGNRWPVKTWFSLKERAIYQADRLIDAALRSDGRLVLVRTRGDLGRFLERRKSEPTIVAAMLAIEGAHALDGDLANVDALFASGYRMMSGAHFFDNEMAGSAHGMDKGGLTELGRDMIRRMEEKKMIVDLSHASPSQIDDVLAIATRPVVVSHTGVRGTCDNRRNLTDDQIKAIAANGGLIGIGFWDTAVCGTDAAAIAKAQRYVADLVGVDHVGLGSDYDGTVAVPFDVSGMVVLTEALMKEGFSHEDIGKIMGGNQIRFMLENLPD